MDSKFALGQVTSAPQEQNLPALFNEGENSQVSSFGPSGRDCTSQLNTFFYFIFFLLNRV